MIIKNILKNIFFLIKGLIKSLKSYDYQSEVINEKFTFLDVYDSYNEALSSSSGLNYKNSDVKSTLINSNSLDIDSRFLIIPFFCSIISKENIRFIEVGGGTNPILLYAQNVCDKNLHSQVLETTDFNIKIPLHLKDVLVYYSKFDDLDFHNIEFLVFSGSFQYLENYEDLLTKFIKAGIKKIFIIETIFTELDENIFTLQNNAGSKFPNTFYSTQRIDEFFSKNNFKNIFSTKRKRNNYTHNILKQNSFYVSDRLYVSTTDNFS